MVNFTTSVKVGKAIGKFFGFVNNKLNPPLKKAGDVIDEKVDRASRASFSE